jgi:uncharacterized protein YjiS (DUF1127 family)
MLATTQAGMFPPIKGPEESLIMLALIARRYLACREQAQMRRELSNMSDRELADMGISRFDIPQIVSQIMQNCQDE